MTSRLLLLLFAPACVLTPTWGEDPTRRDPIDFTGMASRPNAPIRIQAMNHGTGAFETVASFLGDTRRWASDPDLFQWQRVGVRLADRYWVPPGAPCQSSGMANLRVQEINEDGTFLDLATFDAAGKECLDEKLAEGDHPVSAGDQCKRAQATIVLFAPPQCVPARTDVTPPVVTVRLSNAKQVFAAASGASSTTITGLDRTRSAVATALVHDRDGGVGTVQLTGSIGVTCRRTSDGAIVSGGRLPISRSTSRVVTPGALTEISLEVTANVDIPGLLASCPTGTSFVRLTGGLTARGENATGDLGFAPVLTISL